MRLPPLNVLLLLQLAVVGLVAFALAQPLFGVYRASVHSIYVIDASGSMRATDQAPSRFAAAQDRLADMIVANAARPGNRVSVVTAGAQARLDVARQPASANILALLGNLRAIDGPADWSGAAALIGALLVEGENATIVVLTDGADPDEVALAQAFPGVPLQRAVIAGGDSSNIGISASASPVPDKPGRWTIAGHVRFSGEQPDKVTVEALFAPEDGDAFVGLAKTEVRRGTDSATSFALTLELPGSGSVRVQIPDDAGPHDNAAYFTLRRASVAARILYIGESAGPLLTALQAIESVAIDAADDLPSDDATYDLVVIDGVEVARRPATNALWVGAARVLGQPAPVQVRQPYVTGWNAEHALSAGVDWTAVRAQSAFRVPRLAGATVLAESSGMPLVQARTGPRGRDVQIAFRVIESGWSDQSGFPVFVANLVRWSGIEAGALSSLPCVVAAPCPIETRLLSGKITDPDGTEVWSLPSSRAEYLLAGVERSFVPERAGFHKLTAGGVSRVLAVNAAGGAETALAPRNAESSVAAPTAITPRAWWWLLAAALVFLLAEAWIAGMGSEQFLKRAGLARGNPLALRRRLQLGARAAGVVFLLGAVVGVPMLAREPAERIVVVVGSDLGPESRNAQRDRVLREVAGNHAQGVAGEPGGVVATGADTRIAGDFGAPLGPLAPGALRASGPGANLEQALTLAAAMIPAQHAGRVVLATDGNETAGDVARTLASLRARGVAVDIEPLTELQPGEVMVESVKAPARAFAGDTFLLDAVVYSQGAGRARITVKRAGEPLLDREIDLLAGRNRVESRVSAGAAGSLLLEVSVAGARDIFAQNNSKGVFVEVAATPSILIVTPEPPAGDYLVQALGVQGLTASVVTPKQAPKTMDAWLAHDSVVLMNMPAIALETEQQDMVNKFVEQHGRGLLILGGENTFGPGGYFGTAFEKMSPLSSRVKHESPRVALVFVLDRSGSMIGAVDETGKVTRLDIAKQATLTAVSLLNDESRLGIVVFDSFAHVLLPMQERKDEAAVKNAVDPLVPGGGTSIFPGLQAALEMFVGVDASARHIVVMTDGLSQEADFTQLFAIAKQAGITISAIAIGGTADIRQPQEIATKGGGAFYATEDFKALPSILAQETLMLQGSPVQERTAVVKWADRSADFLAGLPNALPPVRSYVRTTAQPQAEVHMTVTEEDGDETPLLASWRYGNGRVLAFATHGAGVGTQDWSRMPEYPLIWAQAIRHFLPETPGPGLHVGLQRVGDQVHVVADLLDKNGAPLRDKVLTASIATPEAEAIRLGEVRPGRYEGDFVVTVPGAYRVEVKGDERTREASIFVANPARYDFGRSDFDKLSALATATGGRMLLGDTALFGDKLAWAAQPGWRLWTLIALALFMLDLGIRHAPGLFGLRKKPRPAARVATA